MVPGLQALMSRGRFANLPVLAGLVALMQLNWDEGEVGEAFARVHNLKECQETLQRLFNAILKSSK